MNEHYMTLCAHTCRNIIVGTLIGHQTSSNYHIIDMKDVLRRWIWMDGLMCVSIHIGMQYAMLVNQTVLLPRHCHP